MTDYTRHDDLTNEEAEALNECSSYNRMDLVGFDTRPGEPGYEDEINASESRYTIFNNPYAN